MAENALAKIARARQALAEAKSLDEFKEIRDQGHAILKYFRSKRDASIETRNEAAEVVIIAECEMGKVLADMEKNKGGRPNANGNGKTGARVAPVSAAKVAEILGAKSDAAAKHVSSRLQTMAALPEPVRHQHIAECKQKGEELTSASVLRLAEQAKVVTKAAEEQPELFGKMAEKMTSPEKVQETFKKVVEKKALGSFSREDVEIKELPDEYIRRVLREVNQLLAGIETRWPMPQRIKKMSPAGRKSVAQAIRNTIEHLAKLLKEVKT